jgi:hypothetical protein
MNLASALAFPLLASAGAEVPLPTRVPGMARDTLIVLIAASAVGLVLLGVLTLWVKTRRSHRHHRHHRPRQRQAESRPTEASSVASEADGTAADADADTGTHRHRRRKRRRDHRPRNPTLAETGGLPPPRPEGQVPPGL